MYTMVLMTALSTSSATPDCCFNFLSCFCQKSYSSCCGYSSCTGCSGCSGYMSTGWGGGYGGSGYYSGAYSGYSGGMLLDGGWGGPPYGGWSVATPYYGQPGYVQPMSPATGTMTAPGTGGNPTPMLPVQARISPPEARANNPVLAYQARPASPAPASDVRPVSLSKKAPEKIENVGPYATRARLVIELPEGAALYVDDHLVKTTSTTASFKTPELERGENYYYQIRVETMRDGKPVSETKKVRVRAGEEVKTSFVAKEANWVAKAR